MTKDQDKPQVNSLTDVAIRLSNRFAWEARFIAIFLTILVVGLTILSLTVLGKIIFLERSVSYADGQLGFGGSTSGAVKNVPTNEALIDTVGSFKDYPLGPDTFMRVLQGVTGTRAYLQLEHLLPIDAYVLSFSAACQTKGGAWHTFLPITESSGDARIDADVNSVMYRAGWDQKLAYAQFPIAGTGEADYGQMPCRLTFVVKK